MGLEYVLGMLYLLIYNLDIKKLSMSKQACSSYGLYLKLLSSTILVYCVLYVYALTTCLNVSPKVQLEYFEGMEHKTFDIVLYEN